jgi:hypothetical protein
MPVQSKELEEASGGASVLPRSTGSGTPPPRVRGRFRSQNAAYYGRRGAAERDRRFLARFRRPEDVRRQERAELRWALGVVQEVFGPSWRPRRQLPPLDDRTIGDLRRALSILHRNFDASTNSHRIRAVWAFLYVLFNPLFFEPVPSWINGASPATVVLFGPPGPGPAGDVSVHGNPQVSEPAFKLSRTIAFTLSRSSEGRDIPHSGSLLQ